MTSRISVMSGTQESAKRARGAILPAGTNCAKFGKRDPRAMTAQRQPLFTNYKFILVGQHSRACGPARKDFLTSTGPID